MGRAVYRTLIGADDAWHVIPMTGPIVHVATRREDAVEVWHIHDTDATPVDRAFRVVGTGHPLAPALAHHVGSAITPSERFVWHLFEHKRAGDPDA